MYKSTEDLLLSCALSLTLLRHLPVIIRFVIPVVFYEITKVECVYSSNTTIFIGRK